MINISGFAPQFQNEENPFTELFSLLKRYQCMPDGQTALAYTAEELIVMQRHTENAIDVLLLGLQGVGKLVSLAAQTGQLIIDDLHYIGFFIAAMSDLAGALNHLRLDAECKLKEGAIMDFYNSV